MLIHEDWELERAAVSGDFDVIVPVSVYLPEDGGEAQITAYDAVWDICKRYEEREHGGLLTDEARRRLCDELEPTVRRLGYDIDRKGSRVILEYRLDGCEPSAEADGGAVIIHSKREVAGIPCLVLHRPEPDPADETDICAVVMCDGAICTVAGVNDYADDDAVEIYVETAKKYRGRGFGTAAVRALAAHLCGQGCSVAYNCAETNRASSGIAERLSMTLVGRRYSIICYAGEIIDSKEKE